MSEVLFSIGEVSRRTGVSADVIRAWERRFGLVAPRRSASNFRLYSHEDIGRLRLMRLYTEQNMPRWRAAELVQRVASTAFDKNPGVPPRDTDQALKALRAALERFDCAPAERLLGGLASVFPPAVILRDVVLPYLRELGERWECGEASVAQEHFASCFLETWMLNAARGWTRAGRCRAVLACVPGEQHVLGLIAFGIALRDLGWSITFLGRDTPLLSACHVMGAVQADALVLAATQPEALALVASDIAACAEEENVLIGGPATEHAVACIPATRILPADVLAAARLLAVQGEHADADCARAGQAALASRGARAGGSGTASMSSGAP
ncbi:MAG: MerR family transcriptional regulator [Thermoleophilia bacterium]